MKTYSKERILLPLFLIVLIGFLLPPIFEKDSVITINFLYLLGDATLIRVNNWFWDDGWNILIDAGYDATILDYLDTEFLNTIDPRYIIYNSFDLSKYSYFENYNTIFLPFSETTLLEIRKTRQGYEWHLSSVYADIIKPIDPPLTLS